MTGASPRLILASASPRRQELLRQAGYEFLIHPSNIDESNLGAGTPSDVVQRLALAKAQTVAREFPADIVLAADTMVSFGERLLGKPADANDARRMLTLLEGTTHLIVTGVVVVHQTQNLVRSRRVLSAVQMKRMTKNQIETLVIAGGWEGKAGGYGIQDVDPFVFRLAGCHTNIVGLPMTTTQQLLKDAGILPTPQ